MVKIVATAAVSISMALPQMASAFTLPPADRPFHSVRVAESMKIAQDFWDTDITLTVYGATKQQMRDAIGTGQEAYGIIEFMGGRRVWLVNDDLVKNDIATRVQTCNTIVHEMGHALHINHNDNPKSIMSTFTPPQNDAVWGCYNRFVNTPKLKRYWHENLGKPTWLSR